ncbi:MAG: hypothetical protein R3A52_27365 [Polyangiales bacterium]
MTFDELSALFASRYPSGCRRCGGVGGLVERAVSPGDLNASPIDEESGLLSDAALRAKGWPIPDDAPEGGDVVRPLRVLPWLGLASRAEAGALLTLDGDARAPEWLLQPEAGAHLAGADYTADLRIAPEAWSWFVMTLRARVDDLHGVAALHLGVRALDDDAVALIVTEGSDAGRLAMRALLAVDDAAIEAALDDRIHGALPQW